MDSIENNSKNLVSIIMGIYNCARTLPDAIDSILAQLYTNWELIMCDDCSTDETYIVAERYANKYPNKIILIRNNRNMRLAYSLNQCLKKACGEYIARMDGDDISRPERILMQIEYLQKHPDINLVGTLMQRFNDQGVHEIVGIIEFPDKYTLRRSMPFYHATIMTYKSVYEDVGGYTVADRTKRAQDYDLWFKFYHAGFAGVNIQQPLYLVREDRDAIRRRTFAVRYNAFKTSCYGFDLLNYPKYWLIRPAVLMILKSLTPYFVVDLLRKFQSSGICKRR